MKKLFNLTLGGGGKLKSSFKISPINVSRKKGFTLAEVLITLAIIGVVAAMTIPAVIVNTNQMEFKTGLRKAVSVLNSAITMNKALTGESPYDNGDLFNYLQQNMSIMKLMNVLGKYDTYDTSIYITQNHGFYTTDGMRFEFPVTNDRPHYLYENRKVKLTERFQEECGNAATNYVCYTNVRCGSYGLSHNPDETQSPPCLIVVDVNGDRKPNKFEILDEGVPTAPLGHTGWSKGLKYADPNGRLLSDVFSIMITDQGAIPYGVVAQKAMYQAQK